MARVEPNVGLELVTLRLRPELRPRVRHLTNRTHPGAQPGDFNRLADLIHILFSSKFEITRFQMENENLFVCASVF